MHSYSVYRQRGRRFIVAGVHSSPCIGHVSAYRLDYLSAGAAAEAENRVADDKRIAWEWWDIGRGDSVKLVGGTWSGHAVDLLAQIAVHRVFCLYLRRDV